MAACEDRSKFSDYFKGLDSTAKARYVEKLSYKDKGEVKPLPDPYSLKKWENNPSTWPDLQFGDIYMYFIETPLESILRKPSKPTSRARHFSFLLVAMLGRSFSISSVIMFHTAV